MANNPLWAADDARLVALFEPKATGSTWSAADAAAGGFTLSNGGITVTPTAASWQTIRGTTSKTSGKLYVEFLAVSAPGPQLQLLGLASNEFIVSGSPIYLGSSNYSGGFQTDANTGAGVIISTGFNWVTSGVGVDSAIIGDVMALAVDFTTGNVWLAHNNVWQGGGNPATDTTPLMAFVLATTGALYPALSLNSVSSGTWTLQPTAASQKYAPPSGFTAWDQTTMDPPITSAPSPPSAPGVTQPQIVSGGQSLPPSFPLGSAGTWMPPPLVGSGGNVPFPTPVVPPGTGVSQTQPQYASGSATAPTAASLFPATTAPPIFQPITMANIMQIGEGPPPYTPGTQPILISNAPAIPQQPIGWPPYYTIKPSITVVTPPPIVGGSLVRNLGTWGGPAGPTFTQQWANSNGRIAGATGPSYVIQSSDVGLTITCLITATTIYGSTVVQTDPTVVIVTTARAEEPANRVTVTHGGGSVPSKKKR